MKQEDLTPEEIAELPKDIQQGLKDGTVLALPVPKTAITNRFYTVALAILVSISILPFWVGVSGFVFGAVCFQALVWLTLYWLEAKQHAQTKMNLSIVEGVMDRTFQMITQAADKAKDINGTNDGESCLKEENDGTGTVH